MIVGECGGAGVNMCEWVCESAGCRPGWPHPPTPGDTPLRLEASVQSSWGRGSESEPPLLPEAGELTFPPVMEPSFQAWLVCCLNGGPGHRSGKDKGSWAVWGPGSARGSKDQGLGSPGPHGLRPRRATLWVSVPDVGRGPWAQTP